MNDIDQLPPHSIEAEQGVLGCILQAKDCLPACLTRFRGHEHVFYDLRHETVFSFVRDMFVAGDPVELLTVRAKLKDAGQLDAIGGDGYLSTLLDSSPSPAGLEMFLGELWQRFVERRSIQLASDFGEAVQQRRAKLPTLLKGLRGAIDGLSDETAPADWRTRRFDATREPPIVRPVFLLDGTPICTPGNLSAITAGIKSGKSAFIGAMIAAAIARNPEDIDSLGITARRTSGALLHFDSEQSPDDHWLLVRRSMARARIESAPAWLASYCLTGMSAPEAWRSVQAAIDEAARQFGSIMAILIDGIGDLVVDVNDPAESNAFVAQLHDIAIKRDCPIIGVIHFNPGSEKVRGHLGSQFERKAETNLALEKADGTTVVWGIKQRRAPIPKEHGPRFAWDDNQRMHVSVASKQDAQLSARADALRDELEDVFRDRRAMRWGELKTTVKTALTVKDKTAERRIKAYRQAGLIEKSAANLWTLTTS